MPRPLTDRERDALIAMIDRAVPSDDDPQPSPDDRRRWRSQIPDIRAGRRCECGQCPSIELCTDASTAPAAHDTRVVLQASTTDALLLLFIDDDTLSYLELAPISDDVAIAEFPDPDAIAF